MLKWLILSLLSAGLILTAACEETDNGADTPTETAEAVTTEAPTEVPTEGPTLEPTQPPEPTDPPAPTQVQNRLNCATIRGTAYRSEEERTWFLANCSAPTPVPITGDGGGCHPSYVGACLLQGAGDYDCAGGSGNGPNYTGRVQVVGYDEFDLDRDGDGVGCE